MNAITRKITSPAIGERPPLLVGFCVGDKVGGVGTVGGVGAVGTGFFVGVAVDGLTVTGLAVGPGLAVGLAVVGTGFTGDLDGVDVAGALLGCFVTGGFVGTFAGKHLDDARPFFAGHGLASG